MSYHTNFRFQRLVSYFLGRVVGSEFKFISLGKRQSFQKSMWLQGWNILTEWICLKLNFISYWQMLIILLQLGFYFVLFCFFLCSLFDVLEANTVLSCWFANFPFWNMNNILAKFQAKIIHAILFWIEINPKLLNMIELANLLHHFRGLIFS